MEDLWSTVGVGYWLFACIKSGMGERGEGNSLQNKHKDGMSIFLLPGIVYAKEGKEEERLWWLVAYG